MAEFKETRIEQDMSMQADIKQQVREFYNQIGWHEVSQGCYQNAAYEDLRPVSREYIHRCHMRVLKHLKTDGSYLLDAGSGPIQYPEYLEYSRHYHRRVCLDISSLALKEARKRIGEHGLYVVGDIASLPFKEGCFGGLVSLHTIHHLPHDEHRQAYFEFYRVLEEGSRGIVVNGWEDAPLMKAANLVVCFIEWLYAHTAGKPAPVIEDDQLDSPENKPPRKTSKGTATGTYVQKHNAAWLMRQVGNQLPIEIFTWRSVGVRFLRTVIHEPWAGRGLLRVLYWLEERFPHFFGRYGQYPLIVLHKPEGRTR